MANLGGTFDATGVEPSKPREPVPPAKYRLQIINSEMRVTKAGTGQLLWLELEILEGSFAGHKLYDQLNLINPSPTAEEIAQRTLSAICHAVGRLQVADSEELHFLPLFANVVVGKSGYNEVKGYAPVAQPPQAAPAPQPAPAAAPAQPAPAPAAMAQPAHSPASATPPWKRAG